MSLQLLVISLLFFQTCLTENQPDDWIDPFDMSPAENYLEYEDDPFVMPMYLKQVKDSSADVCDVKNILSEMYLKRAINMLLNSVHEDYIDDNFYSGHLFFKISSDKYKILFEYARGLNTDNDLEKVDKILSDIFNKPTHEYLQERLEGWFHKLLNLLLSREGIMTVIIATYVFVIIKLFQANFYSLAVLKFILINILIFDFIFTWVYLYQKAQADDFAKKLKYKNVPDECDLSKLTSLGFLINIFSTEDHCKNYYEIHYQDIFYKITPGTVLTEMFARTIQYPAKSIGMAIGEMTKGIYNAFPWPLNVIVLPVGFIFIFLLIVIIISFLFSKTINLNLFHLISFSFGDESQNKIPNNSQDMISGKNLTKLLDITDKQRQYIENIPITAENKEIEAKKDISEEEKLKKRKTKQNLEDNTENMIEDCK